MEGQDSLEEFRRDYFPEDFLHFIWKFKRFDQQELRTTDGESISIVANGWHNHDAGPDFSQAKIRIGQTLWVGNVEIHVYASDWLKHKHQDNKAYDTVILHVVYESDQNIRRIDGSKIACLELKSRISKGMLKSYFKLKRSAAWVPCAKQFNNVAIEIRSLWLDRLMVERIQDRYQKIDERLVTLKGDWEAVFFEFLAERLGGKVNGEPMKALIQSIPFLKLGKHRNKLFQIEAILFGQADMVGNNKDEYQKALCKEYQFLKKKYQLPDSGNTNWRFSRMRPASFPSIRIAQLASLLNQSEMLFSKLLLVTSIEEIENLFEVSLSDYWRSHFSFGKMHKPTTKRIGRSTIHLLIVNVIAPILFLYGKTYAQEDIQQRALNLMEEIPPEDNNILRGWKSVGWQAQNGSQSQALIQLKKEYCDKRQCLNCVIGNRIVNPDYQCRLVKS